MDPLSALALAGNVLQFVEFGVKVLRLTIEFSFNSRKADVNHRAAIQQVRTYAKSRVDQCRGFKREFSRAISSNFPSK